MGRLTRDTVWEGDVQLTGDVLVPAGTRLEIRPGTRVSFSDRPRWACSVFWRSPQGDSIEMTIRDQCDLVIGGRLEVMGTETQPVQLGVGSPAWGGITCFEQGRVDLRGAVLEQALQASIRVFDDAELVAEDSRCAGAEFGLWALGTSRISWTRGGLHARRGSVICREGARAHLVDVEDSSDEGVASMEWALIRVERGSFFGRRKHCVVARQQSWVKLRDCRSTPGVPMSIVRLDDAHVEVAP